MTDRLTDDLPDQLDAAILEYLEAVDHNESIDRQEFLNRHAGVADRLHKFFETARVVESMAGPTLAETAASVAGIDTSRLADTWNPAVTSVPATRLLQVPSRFGRYEVLKKIGQGAMGAVYLANDPQLSRRVALKIPILDETESSEMIDRFYREARATSNLRCPNICPVYDVDQIDGFHFITMAYIEGRSLADWARAQDRTVHEIAAMVSKVARAMARAHQQKIIHRDLKPSNILVDDEGEPVVMDFGLARQLDGGDIRDTKVGTIVGSPAYMSPEQVMGKDVGPQADVYSLGVVLYELLAGRLPFQGQVLSVIGQVLACEPPQLEGVCPRIDGDLAAICRRMMAKDPCNRFESMEEVAQALAQYGAGTSERSPTVEVTCEPERPAPAWTEMRARKRLLTWALIASMVLTAAAVSLLAAASFWRQRNAQTTRDQDAHRDEQESKNIASPLDAKPENRTESSDHVPHPNSAARLRYQFRKGRSYGYALTIEARQGIRKERLSGSLMYRLIDSDNEQLKLRFECRLASRKSSKIPGPEHLSQVGPFIPLASAVGSIPVHDLIIDSQGKIVKNECRDQLPFALGILSELVIEPLSSGDRDRWAWKTRTPLQLAANPIGVPPAALDAEAPNQIPTARVAIDFSRKSIDGSDVVFEKRFSAQPDTKSPAIYPTVTGRGSFSFDRNRGVVTNSQLALHVVGTTQPTEVSIECRLLSPRETGDRFRVDGQGAVKRATIESQILRNHPDVPDPFPGKAVTDQTRLQPGDELQVYQMGRWYDARVESALPDGRVRVQLIGYGAESAKVVARSRLRILPRSAPSP